VIATRLKPAEDGRGWILRLFNASPKPERIVLTGRAVAEGRVRLSDIDGGSAMPLPGAPEIPAWGILTLLIIR
jgi:hypothetical protein